MNSLVKKIIVFGLIFLLNSCGWIENESVKEINVKHGYRVLYDKNNLAFNFFSISYNNGTPLFDDCEEFFLERDYFYVKQSINNSEEFRYYMVNNNTKKILQIKKDQYLISCENCKPINFHDLIRSKKAD